MTEEQKVVIRTDLDVILARTCARDAARSAGFKMVDQARVALATSALARAMGLGGPCEGQIVIDCLEVQEQRGVRVVCQAVDRVDDVPAAGMFDEARRMADELTVEKLSSNDVQATLIKWAD